MLCGASGACPCTVCGGGHGQRSDITDTERPKRMSKLRSDENSKCKRNRSFRQVPHGSWGLGGGVWHGTLCFFFGCQSRCPKPPAFLDSEAWVSEMRDEPDGSSLTTPSAQADLFAALLTGLRTEFCFAWVLGRK